jgi:hypothetical protein
MKVEHAAITNQERLPRHAGPGGIQVRCRCGQVLGLVEDGRLFLRHKGRELTATLPAEVRCERCGWHTHVGLTSR